MNQNQGFEILLFSYGTLQDSAIQLKTFGRTLIGRQDQMTGYRLSYIEITDPEVLASSGKTHHPIISPGTSAQDNVPGMVFQITPQELAAADAYEVSDYKRIAVGLTSGLTAWVYIKA
ncbi:gamma-glutamylcyclotransferase family protein [Pseudomonas azotoformans]